jgi:hypothetical protein
MLKIIGEEGAVGDVAGSALRYGSGSTKMTRLRLRITVVVYSTKLLNK